MAVRSIAPNCYEFTADGDALLVQVKVASFLAVTTDESGDVIITGNIMSRGDAMAALVEDDTDAGEIWRSGVMNANDIKESAVDVGWVRGIKVSMPAGASVKLYHATC